MRHSTRHPLVAGALVASLALPGPTGGTPQDSDQPSPGTPQPQVQELKPPTGMFPGGPPWPPDAPQPPETPYLDPYAPPDEEPPAPPPDELPAPGKVVKVQFCVVDDGRLFARDPSKALATNPGDPDARFGPPPFAAFSLPLLIGVLVKNVLYAPTGVGFAISGPPVFIPDPHPNVGLAFAEGGELGDVAEPGDDLRRVDPELPTSLALTGGGGPAAGLLPVGPVDPPGPAQWAAVQRDCLAAVQRQGGGPLAAGTLLEIVIRRFVLGVDADFIAPGVFQADGRIDEDTVVDNINQDVLGPDLRDGEDDIEASSLLGISPRPKCSQEPPDLKRTPTVVDPEALGVVAFGFVLAHENGHALCLDDAPAGAAPRVMSPRIPPLAPGFTAQEIALLRAQAQHLSGTRDKDSFGRLIERAGPVSRYALDEIFEVDAGEVDLFGAGAAKKEDGSLGLLVELARLIPEHARAVYTLSVDLDASPRTGAAWAPAKGEGLPGTDLQVVVEVLPGAAGLETRATARVASKGSLQALDVPGLEVRLTKVFLPRGAGPQIPVNHSLFLVVPYASLPMPLAEGFRVLVEAARPDGTAHDGSPVVVGSVTPDRSGPLLILEPSAALAGAPVVARGQGFVPGAEVALYAGTVLLGTATADPAGAFAARFPVPVPSKETGQPLARGAVIPLTAVDPRLASDVAFLTVPNGGGAGSVEPPR